MKNLYQHLLCVLGLLLLTTLSLSAQVSDKILSVNTGEANEGQPVTIRADLANAISVSQMFLNYRSAGSSDYKRIEMTVTGNSSAATIPGEEVVPNEIEYYFVMTILLKDGYETYPSENPKNNPLRLIVHPAAPKEQMVTFLSPDTGRAIPADELIIALSLRDVSPLVDLSTMKLFIDGNDVTSSAAIADSLITLDPQKLSTPLENGNHLFRVDMFSKKGQLYTSQTLRFNQGPLFSYEEEPSKFLFNISAQLETRHERFADGWTLPYNRGLVMASTQRGDFTLKGKVYASNEERSNRQPVNQYFIEANTSWLRVAYGDDYPNYPSLIMSGKRLRGLTGNLKLGIINLDYADGNVTRAVEGDTLNTIPHAPDSTNTSGSYAPYDTTNGNTIWAQYRYGTYKRHITAIRPSFGAGKAFQLGFSYLKGKDDVTSILHGINPQENIVLGSDLFIGAFDRKLQITAQGAASVYNSDISKGDISDSDIDALFTGSDSTDKRKQLRDIRDAISKYITVNQNIVPLSTDKLTSLLAYEGGISLDAFDNYLKGTYIFHGSAFRSFGQTYTRNDVKGFNVYDRLRLVKNQVFLSGTFERLQDNTDDTKYATTTLQSWSGSVSYYPRLNFPNITVGIGQNTNSNGLNGLDPNGADSTKARTMRDDISNRFFVQMGYDFNYIARNTVSLNVSSSNTDDKTYNNYDTKTTAISTTIISSWKFPLQSTLGLALNNSKLPVAGGTQRDFNYTTLTLGGRYRLLQERLRLSGMFAPTFGDVKRSVFSFSADYSLLTNLVATFDATVLDYTNGSTDSIISLLLKYNM